MLASLLASLLGFFEVTHKRLTAADRAPSASSGRVERCVFVRNPHRHSFIILRTFAIYCFNMHPVCNAFHSLDCILPVPSVWIYGQTASSLSILKTLPHLLILPILYILSVVALLPILFITVYLLLSIPAASICLRPHSTM